GAVTRVGSSPITQSFTGASTEAINFEVKIQLENPPEDVRPGFSASAEIVTGRRDKATAIPIQALVVREKPEEDGSSARPVEEEGVFLFDDADQTVKFVPVTTGLTGDVLIEIESGLEPAQKIVTGPFSALREISDGDKVKLEKPKKKPNEKS
ncbi:MAG: efflux RND transporter periplasmic adaptor subunit, partial [Acidobacteria bacterium]|nr:efflux RND transporter periplasmic adaptor subunit [Acidobacteriota bacterium]